MIADPIAHFPGQVQSPSIFLPSFHHPDALLLVGKSIRTDPVQHILPGMTERRVAQIMTQSNGLRQFFIQPQRLCYGPGYLGHLQGVGQPRPVMIPLRSQKNLRLMLHPSKCLAVYDPVPVPLVNCADITGLLQPVPAPGAGAYGRVGASALFFHLSQFCA